MIQEDIYTLLESYSPMGVDEYFRLAMYHQDYGYYHRKIPMGQEGDYVTSPEISQVFGELIGLWCLDVWQKLGKPEKIALVELGPGRGTLMTDLLRAAQLDHSFARALEIHLVEISPTLRSQQHQRLSTYSPTWHQELSTLPALPTLFIANEFFDALPHKQYEAQDHLWYERLITCEEQTLTWTRAQEPTTLPFQADPQTIIEIPQEGEIILNQMSTHLKAHQGAALIIDYGSHREGGYGDTLQALYRHQQCSPFYWPGQSDLTFQVNFHHIKKIFDHHGIPEIHGTTQGDFLQKMGIMERTNQLAEKHPQAALASFRLISSQHMGQLFKVLGAASPHIQLIGF